MKIIYIYTEMLVKQMKLNPTQVSLARYDEACNLAQRLFGKELAKKVCNHQAWHVWFSQVWNSDDAHLFFEIEDSGFVPRDMNEAYDLYLHHHQLLLSKSIFPPEIVMRLINGNF